jgi:DNA repair photolyase
MLASHGTEAEFNMLGFGELEPVMQKLLQDSEIRSLSMSAGRTRDPEKSRQAAMKAWRTIRAKKRALASKGTMNLVGYMNEQIALPPGVASGTYKISAPLIKHSKLTNVEKGGIGKELSDGWALNFAIGCMFGCRFCYVDAIHKQWGSRRAGNIVFNDWGYYFALPENLDRAIEETNWQKWSGLEVMLSSTHDPYLPQLYKWTHKILERALESGVRFCIQTRSPLVERDFDLLRQYRKQVRLQVSIATMHSDFARIIEPRVVAPERRVEVLKKAGEAGLSTGVIMAPIFPSIKVRKDFENDVDSLARELAKVSPDHIYGESIHVRGINLAYLEQAIGEKLNLAGFDAQAEKVFLKTLAKHKLKGRWWQEH